ncbi:hypothetical protein F5J12DRAFT_853614, partial [Pisolithus orientalis]|uniref:uncharacterized protein n=1 Tax=Pisolithus orientalis TaxID=936130 RepID=UPI0022245E89
MLTRGGHYLILALGHWVGWHLAADWSPCASPSTKIFPHYLQAQIPQHLPFQYVCKISSIPRHHDGQEKSNPTTVTLADFEGLTLRFKKSLHQSHSLCRPKVGLH